MDSYISALLDFRTTYSEKLIIRTSGEPANHLIENFGFRQSGDRVYLQKDKNSFLSYHSPVLKYDIYIDYCADPAPKGQIDEGYMAAIFDHFGCYKIKVIDNKNFPSITFACPKNGVNEMISRWTGKKYGRQISLGINDVKKIYDQISGEMWINSDLIDLLHCACWERGNLALAKSLE